MNNTENKADPSIQEQMPVTMTKTLFKGLSNIKDSKNENLLAKRTLWARSHQMRVDFIKQLNKILDTKDLKGADRSKLYSDNVVLFDKNNALKGWGV